MMTSQEGITPPPSIELIIRIYEYFYEQYPNVLGHYFRFLYNVFKYVIGNKDTESERRKYIDLIQAQMSSDELGLLFYNALSKYAKNNNGKYQFKEWLERFNFFENINKTSLIREEDKKKKKKMDYKFINPNKTQIDT